MTAFATHLPVLRAVVNGFRPKRVIEYGGGDHSTPFFLSRDLDLLVTVETDPYWADHIDAGDSRHRIVSRRQDPADFDLAFIDDGVSSQGQSGMAQRLATIEFVLTRQHPLTIVHDAEVPDYANLIRQLASNRTTFICTSKPPWTAVIWPPRSKAENQRLLNALEDE